MCPLFAKDGSPVHPRASGERASSHRQRSASSGSSPRERGTQRRPSAAAAISRFIPARAGNAGYRADEELRGTVHPRASGERSDGSPIAHAANGSSPRERGTRPCCGCRGDCRRFIPARAGNALDPMAAALERLVHPRASGERIRANGALAQYAGSSPRERGTPLGAVHRVGLGRFIPARAGNAPSSAPISTSTAVHPRASGEREEADDPEARDNGSSPRERGTLIDRAHAGTWSRFIPARAGNAILMQEHRRQSPVHPRASGERWRKPQPDHGFTGSSPRERGTLGRVNVVRQEMRFIPARAGNAARCRSA